MSGRRGSGRVNPEVAILWDRLSACGLPYTPSAYSLVQDALRYTVERIASEDEGDSRHVSGQELCLGFRDFVNDQFGLLARTVLRTNGIHRTEDVGRIVFAMVEAGLLRKTEEDSIEDFAGVFDFDEAFGASERLGV